MIALSLGRFNREVRTRYWRLDSGKEGEAFLVLAEQHGNEVQGCEVIRPRGQQLGPVGASMQNRPRHQTPEEPGC
jgi:hypothetical protein